MMQQTPPTGKLFPDHPQQPSGPRFASNAPHQAPQTYEPQQRMQQTGSYQPIHPSYGTGHLTPLHEAPRQQPGVQNPPQQTAPAAVEGTPLMVHTVQGVPVAVTAEEMERALAEMQERPGRRNKRLDRYEDAREQNRRKRSRRFSLVWNVFAFVGIISVILLILEWVGIPLLVLLNDLKAGGTP